VTSVSRGRGRGGVAGFLRDDDGGLDRAALREQAVADILNPRHEARHGPLHGQQPALHRRRALLQKRDLSRTAPGCGASAEPAAAADPDEKLRAPPVLL
jgi:hypothetical protein